MLTATVALPQRGPTPTHALHAQPCGDLDGSGKVTEVDIFTVLSYFGQSVPPGPPAADLDGSGAITNVDFFTLLGQFGLVTGCQDTPIAAQAVESASQLIGAGGGSVHTGNTNVVEASLTVPAGALSSNTNVTIDAINSSGGDVISLPHVLVPASKPRFLPRVFDFGPNGQALSVPATLTLSYTNAAITQGNEATLGVIHFVNDAWEYVPVVTRDTALNTITVQISSFSIYGIYEPVTNDTDSDGCRDVDEQQTLTGTEISGGLRNPLTFWDFFDTPTGVFPSLARDGAIAGTDLFAVLQRFGASGTAGDNPLTTPLNDAPNYHTMFDRTGAQVPPSAGAWNAQAPDGFIAGTDFFSVLGGLNHVCVTP